MFKRLRSGGKLVITNFVPSIEESAYMEAFMKWFLIYRDMGQFDALASCLPQEKIFEKKVYRNSSNTILFMEITSL